MKRMKIMGTLLAAVFVIGLVGAASAAAHGTNNPQWLILANILKAGETVGVHAEQIGVQKLSGTGVTIECTQFSLAAGAILIGSNAPAPGTSEETIRYSTCEVAGSATCKINNAVPGKIETKPLRDLLVFLTKEGALKEEAAASGTLFEPKTAPTFAEFLLSGAAGACPLTGTLKVDGTGVLVNNLNVNHEVSHEIEAPAVAKKAYFVNEGGSPKEKTGVKITLGGLAATYTGKAKILLTNQEPWGIFN